jgi:hypothetical protein
MRTRKVAAFGIGLFPQDGDATFQTLQPSKGRHAIKGDRRICFFD